ncbi:hypothetical protein JTE90_022487 [Oedothorax gibbosus]|uniref:VWFC domain-containing protein n=1 Tax=Oedothorax gibbosus TaxID=931172 RepID=A0AAV6UZ07_9ARAC|nr:hypothetical protein JTE90_022487 [Oedothorax gibbosus]
MVEWIGSRIGESEEKWPLYLNFYLSGRIFCPFHPTLPPMLFLKEVMVKWWYLSGAVLAVLLLVDTAPVIEPKPPHRSPRNRGCFYLNQHYDNGEHVQTKEEPCLNCTCVNSMLMCYLRVCPFVKPDGVGKCITAEDDQCCPKVWCAEVLKDKDKDSEESKIPHDQPGCYLDNKYYPDGSQLPHDPAIPCEVCYCIRNRSECIIQECDLKLEGCSPVFRDGQCCPSRYNCTYDEETTTTPPGVTVSDLAEGCDFGGVLYADGEPVNSTSPCKHCYCMRNELVCAIQECHDPGNNCKPVKSKPDQCCPDKYECEIPAEKMTATEGFLSTEKSGLTFSSVFATPETPTNSSEETDKVPIKESDGESLDSKDTKINEVPETENKIEEPITPYKAPHVTITPVPSSEVPISTENNGNHYTPTESPATSVKYAEGEVDKDDNSEKSDKGSIITESEETTTKLAVTETGDDSSEPLNVLSINPTPSIKPPYQETAEVAEEATVAPAQEHDSVSEETTVAHTQETDNFSKEVTMAPAEELGGVSDEATVSPAQEIDGVSDVPTMAAALEHVSVSEEATVAPAQDKNTASEMSTVTPAQETESVPKEATLAPENLTEDIKQHHSENEEPSNIFQVKGRRPIVPTIFEGSTGQPNSAEIETATFNGRPEFIKGGSGRRPSVPTIFEGSTEQPGSSEVDVETATFNGRPEFIKGSPSSFSSVKGKRPQRPFIPIGTIPGEQAQPVYIHPHKSSVKGGPIHKPIPGEATCHAYGITYQHGDPVESTNKCQQSCSCVNGRIFCVETICSIPDQEIYVNCRATYTENECCPQYDCGSSVTKPIESIDLSEYTEVDGTLVSTTSQSNEDPTKSPVYEPAVPESLLRENVTDSVDTYSTLENTTSPINYEENSSASTGSEAIHDTDEYDRTTSVHDSSSIETTEPDTQTTAADLQTKASVMDTTPSHVQTTAAPDAQTTVGDVQTTPSDGQTSSSPVTQSTVTEVQTIPVSESQTSQALDVTTSAPDAETTTTDVQTKVAGIHTTPSDAETTYTPDVQTNIIDVQTTSTSAPLDVQTSSALDVTTTAPDAQTTFADIQQTQAEFQTKYDAPTTPASNDQTTMSDVQTTSIDTQTTDVHSTSAPVDVQTTAAAIELTTDVQIDHHDIKPQDESSISEASSNELTAFSSPDGDSFSSDGHAADNVVTSSFTESSKPEPSEKDAFGTTDIPTFVTENQPDLDNEESMENVDKTIYFTKEQDILPAPLNLQKLPTNLNDEESHASEDNVELQTTLVSEDGKQQTTPVGDEDVKTHLESMYAEVDNEDSQTTFRPSVEEVNDSNNYYSTSTILPTEDLDIREPATTFEATEQASPNFASQKPVVSTVTPDTEKPDSDGHGQSSDSVPKDIVTDFVTHSTETSKYWEEEIYSEDPTADVESLTNILTPNTFNDGATAAETNHEALNPDSTVNQEHTNLSSQDVTYEGSTKTHDLEYSTRSSQPDRENTNLNESENSTSEDTEQFETNLAHHIHSTTEIPESEKLDTKVNVADSVSEDDSHDQEEVIATTTTMPVDHADSGNADDSYDHKEEVIASTTATPADHADSEEIIASTTPASVEHTDSVNEVNSHDPEEFIVSTTPDRHIDEESFSSKPETVVTNEVTEVFDAQINTELTTQTPQTNVPEDKLTTTEEESIVAFTNAPKETEKPESHVISLSSYSNETSVEEMLEKAVEKTTLAHTTTPAYSELSTDFQTTKTPQGTSTTTKSPIVQYVTAGRYPVHETTNVHLSSIPTRVSSTASPTLDSQEVDFASVPLSIFPPSIPSKASPSTSEPSSTDYDYYWTEDFDPTVPEQFISEEEAIKKLKDEILTDIIRIKELEENWKRKINRNKITQEPPFNFPEQTELQRPNISEQPQTAVEYEPKESSTTTQSPISVKDFVTTQITRKQPMTTPSPTQKDITTDALSATDGATTIKEPIPSKISVKTGEFSPTTTVVPNISTIFPNEKFSTVPVVTDTPESSPTSIVTKQPTVVPEVFQNDRLTTTQEPSATFSIVPEYKEPQRPVISEQPDPAVEYESNESATSTQHPLAVKDFVTTQSSTTRRQPTTTLSPIQADITTTQEPIVTDLATTIKESIPSEISVQTDEFFPTATGITNTSYAYDISTTVFPNEKSSASMQTETSESSPSPITTKKSTAVPETVQNDLLTTAQDMEITDEIYTTEKPIVSENPTPSTEKATTSQELPTLSVSTPIEYPNISQEHDLTKQQGEASEILSTDEKATISNESGLDVSIFSPEQDQTTPDSLSVKVPLSIIEQTKTTIEAIPSESLTSTPVPISDEQFTDKNESIYKESTTTQEAIEPEQLFISTTVDHIPSEQPSNTEESISSDYPPVPAIESLSEKTSMESEDGANDQETTRTYPSEQPSTTTELVKNEKDDITEQGKEITTSNIFILSEDSKTTQSTPEEQPSTASEPTIDDFTTDKESSITEKPLIVSKTVPRDQVIASFIPIANEYSTTLELFSDGDESFTSGSTFSEQPANAFQPTSNQPSQTTTVEGVTSGQHITTTGITSFEPSTTELNIVSNEQPTETPELVTEEPSANVGVFSPEDSATSEKSISSEQTHTAPEDDFVDPVTTTPQPVSTEQTGTTQEHFTNEQPTTLSTEILSVEQSSTVGSIENEETSELATAENFTNSTQKFIAGNATDELPIIFVTNEESSTNHVPNEEPTISLSPISNNQPIVTFDIISSEKTSSATPVTLPDQPITTAIPSHFNEQPEDITLTELANEEPAVNPEIKLASVLTPTLEEAKLAATSTESDENTKVFEQSEVTEDSFESTSYDSTNITNTEDEVDTHSTTTNIKDIIKSIAEVLYGNTEITENGEGIETATAIPESDGATEKNETTKDDAEFTNDLTVSENNKNEAPVLIPENLIQPFEEGQLILDKLTNKTTEDLSQNTDNEFEITKHHTTTETLDNATFTQDYGFHKETYVPPVNEESSIPTNETDGTSSSEPTVTIKDTKKTSVFSYVTSALSFLATTYDSIISDLQESTTLPPVSESRPSQFGDDLESLSQNNYTDNQFDTPTSYSPDSDTKVTFSETSHAETNPTSIDAFKLNTTYPPTPVSTENYAETDIVNEFVNISTELTKRNETDSVLNTTSSSFIELLQKAFTSTSRPNIKDDSQHFTNAPPTTLAVATYSHSTTVSPTSEVVTAEMDTETSTMHKELLATVASLFPHSGTPSILTEAHHPETPTTPRHPHKHVTGIPAEFSDPSGSDDAYCLYNNEYYASTEQIPRKDPCEFCFCFRGDIICLQQSCPPPIQGCYATPIEGFCCPRFHCPVQEMHFNVTNKRTTTTTTADPRQSKLLEIDEETTGCAIDGKVYRVHQVVRPASGPCMQCRCEMGGIMKCDPKDCQPSDTLLMSLNNAFFKKK